MAYEFQGLRKACPERWQDVFVFIEDEIEHNWIFMKSVIDFIFKLSLKLAHRMQNL
jgi:hypothetical protein